MDWRSIDHGRTQSGDTKSGLLVLNEFYISLRQYNRQTNRRQFSVFLTSLIRSTRNTRFRFLPGHGVPDTFIVYHRRLLIWIRPQLIQCREATGNNHPFDSFLLCCSSKDIQSSLASRDKQIPLIICHTEMIWRSTVNYGSDVLDGGDVGVGSDNVRNSDYFEIVRSRQGRGFGLGADGRADMVALKCELCRH